jgi:hypothetical protein
MARPPSFCSHRRLLYRIPAELWRARPNVPRLGMSLAWEANDLYGRGRQPAQIKDPNIQSKKLIRIGREIPPRPTHSRRGDHVVRHVNSVSRFTRSRKLSNRTLPAANAPFAESDCTCSGGKVAQPTTSIVEMACLVNIASRPTDRNALPARSRLQCRVVGPVLASNFRVARDTTRIVAQHF